LRSGLQGRPPFDGSSSAADSLYIGQSMNR